MAEDTQEIFESEDQCGKDCTSVYVKENGEIIYTFWVKRNNNVSSSPSATVDTKPEKSDGSTIQTTGSAQQDPFITETAKKYARYLRLQHEYQDLRRKKQTQQMKVNRNKYATGIKSLSIYPPDYVHNAILLHLLETDYSNNSLNNSKLYKANGLEDYTADQAKSIFDAVRSQSNQLSTRLSATQSPVYIAKRSGTPVMNGKQKVYLPVERKSGAVIRSGTYSYFVRDFMQLQSRGGEAGIPLQIKGFTIEDKIALKKTVFAAKFNDFVDKINDNVSKNIKQTSEIIRYLDAVGHRDAIQLIPKRTGQIDQMGGAMMSHVSITGNHIYSTGKLQGIFATDGAFKDLTISNNTVEVGGEHSISINGMLSGSISGNTYKDGQPLGTDKITLYPLRLGGDANVYVLGFYNHPGLPKDLEHYYHYDIIAGIDKRSDFRTIGREQDLRPKSDATFYTNVNMEQFHRLYKTKPVREIMQILVQQKYATEVSKETLLRKHDQLGY